MKFNKNTAIAVGILVTLVFGGAFIFSKGFDVFAQKTETMQQTKITKEQAQKIALERVKGTIEDGELETENGILIYSFDIRNEKGTITEIQVDAKTGKIVSVEEENAEQEAAEKSKEQMETNESEEADEAALAAQAKITKAEAEKIALNRASGKVEDGELEMENGKLVYSFDIRNAKGTITEVQVDAKDGKIVSVEEETAEMEAAEKSKEKMERKEKDDDDNETPAAKNARIAKLSAQASITMEQAKAIALQRIPGTVTDQDLEKERGVLQYSFDIKDATGKVFDVEIDAKTGKVLKAVEDKEDEDGDN